MLQGTPYSKFLNQRIIFEGVYNAYVGEVTTNYENQLITVNITSTSPHSFYKGKTYLSVQVMDNAGSQIYERIAEGITTLSYHEVPMREGFLIKIFHLEAPARLISPDGIAYSGVNRTTETFLVTRYGLKNLALGNNPLYIFLQKLYENAGDLRGSSIGSDTVRHVLIGARSLPQPYRTQFVMKYNRIMSECYIMFVIRSESDDAQGTLAVTSKQGIQNLVGTVVNIRNGDDIILQDTVQPYTNLFNYANIPYGVYSIEFRGKAAQAYIISPQYIEVKNNVHPVIFDFIPIDNSLLVSDIPLDSQMSFINAKANDISMSAPRAAASLYMSDEKKILLAAIRSLPAESQGSFLNKFGPLLSTREFAERSS